MSLPAELTSVPDWLRAYWEEVTWRLGAQLDAKIMSGLSSCICGHGAQRHNNADSCDICECKEYQG